MPVLFVALLVRRILPPLALTRRPPSLDETSMFELTLIAPSEVRLTVPPLPPVIPFLLFRPLVAMMGLLTVIAPADVTVSTPPLPPASLREGSASPPSKLALLIAV